MYEIQKVKINNWQCFKNLNKHLRGIIKKLIEMTCASSSLAVRANSEYFIESSFELY